MLTQCSHCKKTYTLSIEELRNCTAVLQCPKCEQMLGRLKSFNTDFFSGETRTLADSSLWRTASMLCLVVLITQAYIVKRDKFGQNPQQRVLLEKICQTLHCVLPVYKNLDEFEILHGDFHLKDNQYYVFRTVLSNQADFQQHYPLIRLALLDFTGQVFAERVFFPHEYLHTEKPRLMSASETIEVSLDIDLPKQKVGGYTFELL